MIARIDAFPGTVPWRERAACRASTAQDLFADALDVRAPMATVDACRAVCKQCPVATWCLASALSRNEGFGVWGGLDPAERRDVARVLSDDVRNGLADQVFDQPRYEELEAVLEIARR